MATSGTYSTVANYTVSEIFDEAFRRCRIDVSAITGEMLTSAEYSMDLMFIDWANQGYEQFITDKQIFPLVGDGTDISFSTPSGTIDVISMVYRNYALQDLQIKPISRQDYLYINDKTVEGQPVCYFTDKTYVPPTVFLWPVQNIAGTYVVYNRLRQMQDVGALTNTTDSTVMYKEAMIAGIADLLWEKYGDDAKYPQQGERLSLRAQLTFNNASNQDRDRADYVIKPRLGRRFYYGV